MGKEDKALYTSLELLEEISYKRRLVITNTLLSGTWNVSYAERVPICEKNNYLHHLHTGRGKLLYFIFTYLIKMIVFNFLASVFIAVLPKMLQIDVNSVLP